VICWFNNYRNGAHWNIFLRWEKSWLATPVMWSDRNVAWQTWFFWWLLGNLGQQHTLITKRVLPVDCRSISPFFPTYLLQMCREMEAYLGKFRQHLWHCSQEAAMLSRPVKPTDYNNKVHAPPGSFVSSLNYTAFFSTKFSNKYNRI